MNHSNIIDCMGKSGAIYSEIGLKLQKKNVGWRIKKEKEFKEKQDNTKKNNPDNLIIAMNFEGKQRG